MDIRISGAWLGVLLAAAGCADPPLEAQYPIALTEALARLEKADITGFRNARQCGILIHFSAWHRDRTSIGWIVTSRHQQVATFEVSLSAAGNGTNAAIVVPKAEDGGEMYDGNQHYSHPAMMQPLRPALRELIDAAMQQRPYDWRRIPDPLNTDGLCSSELQNLMAGGATYQLGDPEGMTHEDAVRAGLSR